jgi:hypothetical protein
MYHDRNEPTTWINILGETIPPERVGDSSGTLYHMPPEKDQLLGNYWWVVCIRPIGGNKRYEYMINKEYSYSRMFWGFTQQKTFKLAANRWYYEGPIEKTLSSCLYPYYQYCPGLDIDFRRCNTNLQLNRLQYMEESKEPPRNLHGLSPTMRADKKRESHTAVQLLEDIGALPDSTMPSLEEYLRELEASHAEAQASLKRNPFATARKFLLMQRGFSSMRPVLLHGLLQATFGNDHQGHQKCPEPAKATWQFRKQSP